MFFWSYLHFFAFLVYLFIVGYMLVRNFKDPLNLACCGVALCLALWSLQRVFTQFPLSTKETALFWISLGSFGWIGFVAFLVCYYLIFTERYNILKNKIFLLVNSAIPLLLVYQQWNGQLCHDFVRQPFGWVYVWKDSFWTHAYWGYYISVFLIVISSILVYAKGSNKPLVKKHSIILSSVLAFSIVTGTVIDVVLPTMKIYVIPPLGDVFGMVWAIGFAYLVVRYRLVTPSLSSATESIISTMTDPVVILLPGGNIAAVNDSTCVLMGYDRKELVGKKMTGLFSDHSIGKFDLKAKDFVEFIQETKNKLYDMTFVTKEGHKIPVLITATPIYDQRDRLEGVIVVAKDVTIMRKAREELKSLNYKLKTNEKAVLNVLADLKKSHEELKNSQEQLLQSAKLVSVGRLAADMAHEVNNPLMIISGRAQLLMMMANPAKKELDNGLKIIFDQCQRAKDVIQRLLMFARPSRGEIKHSDITDIIDFVIGLLEHQYSLKRVEIVRSYQPDLPFPEMDEKQIYEVFMNLFKNAADAMPEGGTITVSATAGDGKVKVDITDTGVGMSEEDLQKIFDPFFTTKPDGTGLGLSVCYGIIQAHGGTLSYKSKPGEGTTATIKLPATAT